MAKRRQSAREKFNTRGRERSQLKDVFLKTYPEYGTIQATCVKIGISRDVVYQWFKDINFQNAFLEADKHLKEVFENAAMYRGVKGVTRYVLHKGKPVIDPTDPNGTRLLTYQEYSDHCLEMLLAAKDPERYGRRNRTEVKIDIQLMNQVASEILSTLRRNIPDACPHCKNLLDITPAIAKDLERISTQFETATG